jgi:sugar O-acyltransferase (sialic acid O-acetyltransferase NeuD family)
MNNTKQNSWTIFGLSNFSYDILDAIKSNGDEVKYFVRNQDVDEDIVKRMPQNIEIIDLADFEPSTDKYFIGFMDYRKDTLITELNKFNLNFDNVIHRHAYISPYSTIGMGNFIGANATIAPKVNLGDFNFINRNCSVGHHTVMGNRNKTGPGVTICSLCEIADKNAFGANCTIIPELKIASEVEIGAGAVVTDNISESGLYVGIPAKLVQRKA